MTKTLTAKPRAQLTGNSGLYYAAWQLTRRGWYVMPTVRNARGSDLIVTNDDETVFFGVQSKALSKRSAVPLGLDLTNLRSEWWIITVNANSDNPTCYLLRLDEVRALAGQDRNGGAWWLDAKQYDKDEYRDAWHRLTPNVVVAEEPAGPVASPEQNGIRRPKPEGLCGQAWAVFDEIMAGGTGPITLAAAMPTAKTRGLNEANVRTEFYRWRRFNGISGGSQ